MPKLIEAWRNRALLYSVLGVALLTRLFVEWGQPFHHIVGLRQTQTGLNIYWYLRDGIDLLRPPIPIFGADAPAIPTEFPLHQALAALALKLLGEESVEAIEIAARAVTFGFYLIAGVVLHGILRRQISTIAADAAIVLWLLMPFPYFWSLTAVNDFVALAFALMYLDQVLKLAQDEKASTPRLWLVGSVGALCFLTKVTTAMVLAPPIGLLYLHHRGILRRWRLAARDWFAFAIAFAAPAAIGYAWVLWSDHVKSLNAMGAATLMSGGQGIWVLGPLEQRFQAETWSEIFLRTMSAELLALVAVPFFLIGVVLACRRLELALAWILPIPIALLVLTNSYYFHPYYFIALLGCIVVPVALGLDFTVEKLRRAGRREGAHALRAAVLPVFLCLAMWGTAFWAGGVATALRDAKPVHHFFLPFLQSPTPPVKHRGLLRAAEVVKANSGPDDVIMVTGMLMSSELPFYAERRAILISSLIDNCTEPVWSEVRKSKIAVYVDYVDENSPPKARDPGCRYVGRDEQCRIAQIEGFWIGSCYRDRFDDFRD